ncbi:hypothetical protein GCM10020220_021290 [Nonomuraea rubra]|uniref:hypothetical protein n=1 Tax=Nonomuraea rubra TaxID=46180 RepID=UPI0031EF3833
MGFGVREFELALLHRMRDVNAEKVEETLGLLGASRAELREAHAHWTRLAHAPRAPKGAAALRRALGPPPHRGRRPAGSLTCDVLRWPLPTWPGLAYEALVGPGGELWNQWFVRPSGAAALTFADLVPWACVVGGRRRELPRRRTDRRPRPAPLDGRLPPRRRDASRPLRVRPLPAARTSTFRPVLTSTFRPVLRLGASLARCFREPAGTLGAQVLTRVCGS